MFPPHQRGGGIILISESDRRRAFSAWLRTGLLPAVRDADGTELKFNPWHDPEDGRFTFAGTGRYYGRGAGQFGGGGATGSWPPASRPHPAPKQRQSLRSVVVARPTEQRTSSSRGSTHATTQKLQPFRRIVRNGYSFRIDEQGRTHEVTGPIVLATTPGGSRRAQAAAGRPDRRASDDGGHYIAARFDGPKDAFNHFAQDANFNRGAYRMLEERWARAKRQGKLVTVRIVPEYGGTSVRPTAINVWFFVDGHMSQQRFSNERAENSGGK